MKRMIRASADANKSYEFQGYTIYNDGAKWSVYKGGQLIHKGFATAEEAEDSITSGCDIKCSDERDPDEEVTYPEWDMSIREVFEEFGRELRRQFHPPKGFSWDGEIDFDEDGEPLCNYSIISRRSGNPCYIYTLSKHAVDVWYDEMGSDLYEGAMEAVKELHATTDSWTRRDWMSHAGNPVYAGQ